MNKTSALKIALIATCLVAQFGTAGVLTNIAFTSNGGNFINDTILGNGTSPLAFTAVGATNNPFLNNADSTISLNFGN